MQITVTYQGDGDSLTGVVDGRSRAGERTVEWSDDLRFTYAGSHVTGFEIRPFSSFVDYVPFYKLFGGSFVEWLSDLQSDVAKKRRKESREYQVLRQSKSARRFERNMASA